MLAASSQSPPRVELEWAQSYASAATLYVGCALFGIGVGNMISLPGLIVQQEFSKQHFSRIVSLIVAINQFTFAFGPGFLGYLHQAEDSYVAALTACVLMQSAAAIIVVAPLLGRIMGRLSRKLVLQ